jgi:hypothetical protein
MKVKPCTAPPLYSTACDSRSPILTIIDSIVPGNALSQRTYGLRYVGVSSRFICVSPILTVLTFDAILLYALVRK